MWGDIQFAEFRDKGFVRLGQVASDQGVRDLQGRMEDIMMGRVRREGLYFQMDSETGVYSDLDGGGTRFLGPSTNYRKIQNLELDEVFLAYVRHPVFRQITDRVIGPEVSVFRCMFMNKPPRRGTVLPYHQDGGGGWGLTLDPIVTVWTALDDATRENGCVQVIPGSHRLGLLSEQGHTISAEDEARYAREEESVYLEARAGEVILLHNWLLHRSGVNTIERARRAFSVCYMDATTRSVKTGRGFPVVFGQGALQAA